jgi:hypothetical protein
MKMSLEEAIYKATYIEKGRILYGSEYNAIQVLLQKIEWYEKNEKYISELDKNQALRIKRPKIEIKDKDVSGVTWRMLDSFGCMIQIK